MQGIRDKTMPKTFDVNHYLLHFRLERDDETATMNIRRRAALIVTAFETAPINAQTSLSFLIVEMTKLTGPPRADADIIRGLAQTLKTLDADNRPIELVVALGDN